jgi:3-dehydroquinate dehydratase-2
MNILIINGPNLNFLGKREVNIYGKSSYHDLVNFLLMYAQEKNHFIEVYQTNHEGEIIDLIQDNHHRFEAIIINPAAYTHYSYAIYDCLKSIDNRVVEVHLSNIYEREDFRKISVIKNACEKQFFGKGFDSYVEAIEYLNEEV